MTINEYTKKIDESDANDYWLKKINKDVVDAYQQFYRSFLSYPMLVDIERESHPKTIECDINNQLKSITRTYREEILKVAPNYNRQGMLVWSFADIDLTDEVGKMFNFNFNKKSYKDRVKMNYSKEKLVRTMILALALLFAKYKNVYIFQIQATYLKVLVDFFDYSTIIHNELFQIYTDLINMNIDIIVAKFKELNFKHKPVLKKERKPRKKTELPTKEEFEAYIASGKYTRTQLEQILSEKLHCSARTIHRKLVEYGLTRNYKM